MWFRLAVCPPGIVAGANLEPRGCRRQLARQLPFAKRIFSEILAELCRRQVFRIERDRDFLDALAARRSNSFTVVPPASVCAIGHMGNEGADGEAVDRDGRLWRGAGSTQPQGVSGIR